MPYPKDTDDWEAIYKEYYQDYFDKEFRSNMKFTYSVGSESGNGKNDFQRLVERRIRDGLRSGGRGDNLKALLGMGRHSHQVHISDLYVESNKHARTIMIENSVRSARERGVPISESDMKRHQEEVEGSYAKFERRRDRLKSLERIALGRFKLETINRIEGNMDKLNAMEIKRLETLSKKAIPQRKVNAALRAMFLN